MTFGERLTQLRKENGYSTRKSFAEKLNIPETTLRNYETDEREAGHTFLKQMADFFNVSCDYLMGVTEEREKMTSYSLKSSEYSMVEKYRLISTHSPDGAIVVDTVLDREHVIAEKLREQKEQLEKARKMDMEVAEEIVPFRIISYHQKLASAGNGQVVFDDGVTNRIEIPDIPKYKHVSYAIGVNGKSMEPLYHDGDILLIEPTCQVEIGEIGIFIVDGEAFVKKLGNGELISLNKGHKNITLTEYSNCMGRVVDRLKND
jgi:phage repressor protein C with HTH and peptisase S24 domain/DNA-binding XRE family transcriptional regulator